MQIEQHRRDHTTSGRTHNRQKVLTLNGGRQKGIMTEFQRYLMFQCYIRY